MHLYLKGCKALFGNAGVIFNGKNLKSKVRCFSSIIVE